MRMIGIRRVVLWAVLGSAGAVLVLAGETKTAPVSQAEKAAKDPAKVPGGDPQGTIAAYQARLKDMPKFDKPLMFNTRQADEVLKHVQVFPANNPFNEDISGRPVAANSDAMIATMKDRKNLAYNLDMTYIIVPPEQPPVDVKLLDYAEESDAGPYPVPDNAPIEEWNPEGKEPLAVKQAKVEPGDRHVLVLDPFRGLLYEFWQTRKTPQGWQASNEATFDIKTNALRPDGWTSADAAGLPVFPLTVRYDNVAGGEVRHAVRFTVHRTRAAYVYPATHKASNKTDKDLPRMGERFRLKAAVDIWACAARPGHLQGLEEVRHDQRRQRRRLADFGRTRSADQGPGGPGKDQGHGFRGHRAHRPQRRPAGAEKIGTAGKTMIKGLAHVCFVVGDLERSLSFYRDKLGLAPAFDFVNDQGERFGIYLHAGGRGFLELFVGKLDQRAAGQAYQHLCLEVDDLPATVAAIRLAGVEVSEPKTGSDRSVQAWLSDPDGNRIELHQYTPQSKQGPWVK